MIITDMHTHTTFSGDGKSTIEEMLDRAVALGVQHYGITDHFDYDYTGVKGRYWTDAKAYFTRARELQEKYKDKLKIYVGAELGYQNIPQMLQEINEIVKEYKPDFLINSVHFLTFDKTELGEEQDRHSSYERYFSWIRNSLDAPYPYDIVGHLSFCVRYAPFKERTFSYAEHQETLDDILKKIIELGKVLEINSKASPARFDGDARIEFVPSQEILQRYYDLGGRKISYGSDAHFVADIVKGRETAIQALKEIGFEYLTLPVCGEEVRIPL